MNFINRRMNYDVCGSIRDRFQIPSSYSYVFFRAHCIESFSPRKWQHYNEVSQVRSLCVAVAHETCRQSQGEGVEVARLVRPPALAFKMVSTLALLLAF